MPKSKHRKKTPKRKPKTNKPIKQAVKKTTLNDTAQDIIDLYSNYTMSSEYDNIPLTVDLMDAKREADQLISRIQSGAADIDEIGFTLDDYFMSIEDAAEERGFILGYLYAVTHADNVIHDEERGDNDGEKQ